jgi:hypothetical protein
VNNSQDNLHIALVNKQQDNMPIVATRTERFNDTQRSHVIPTDFNYIRFNDDNKDMVRQKIKPSSSYHRQRHISSKISMNHPSINSTSSPFIPQPLAVENFSRSCSRPQSLSTGQENHIRREPSTSSQVTQPLHVKHSSDVHNSSLQHEHMSNDRKGHVTHDQSFNRLVNVNIDLPANVSLNVSREHPLTNHARSISTHAPIKATCAPDSDIHMNENSYAASSSSTVRSSTHNQLNSSHSALLFRQQTLVLTPTDVKHNRTRAHHQLSQIFSRHNSSSNIWSSPSSKSSVINQFNLKNTADRNFVNRMSRYSSNVNHRTRPQESFNDLLTIFRPAVVVGNQDCSLSINNCAETIDTLL